MCSTHAQTFPLLDNIYKNIHTGGFLSNFRADVTFCDVIITSLWPCVTLHHSCLEQEVCVSRKTSYSSEMNQKHLPISRGLPVPSISRLAWDPSMKNQQLHHKGQELDLGTESQTTCTCYEFQRAIARIMSVKYVV